MDRVDVWTHRLVLLGLVAVGVAVNFRMVTSGIAVGLVLAGTDRWRYGHPRKRSRRRPTDS